jgi:hypothetical protein
LPWLRILLPVNWFTGDDESDLEVSGSIVNVFHSFNFPEKIVYYFLLP